MIKRNDVTLTEVADMGHEERKMEEGEQLKMKKEAVGFLPYSILVHLKATGDGRFYLSTWRLNVTMLSRPLLHTWMFITENYHFEYPRATTCDQKQSIRLTKCD